jgi:hypothetical protein
MLTWIIHQTHYPAFLENTVFYQYDSVYYLST